MPRRFFVLAVAPRETPRLNTLNATVDNVVADQMDNLPEAKMMPERPELMV